MNHSDALTLSDLPADIVRKFIPLMGSKFGEMRLVSKFLKLSIVVIFSHKYRFQGFEKLGADSSAALLLFEDHSSNRCNHY